MDQFTVHEFPCQPNSASAPQLKYLLHSPDLSDEPYLPLLLCLHGSGERGNNPRRLMSFIGTDFVDETFQEHHPCYVVVPQCPPGMQWYSESPFDMQDTLATLLTELKLTQAIDASRIYLVGFSMGGFGCWHFGAHSNEEFAALLPVAGGGKLDTAAQLASVPIWAVHGSVDTVVAPSRSQEMFDAVNSAGGNAKLSILEGVGHRSWDNVRTTPNKYIEWLFQQSKSASDSG